MHIPLSGRVALALEAAGLAPVTAMDFDQVTAAGWRVRTAHHGAVHVYAELPSAPAVAEALRSAAADGAASWLAASARSDAARQAQREELLSAYATALRAEGFTARLLDKGDVHARLYVPPFPPCGRCDHTEARHRDGRCVVCSVLRMNNPRHAYVNPQEQQ
jgi:hypothetical protein